MGYTTSFKGAFKLDRELEPDHKKYLAMFSSTRRMERDPNKIFETKTPCVGNVKPMNQECLNLLKKVGLELGPEGDYYCGTGMCGQDRDKSILDYNHPPSGQPCLWCQWVPVEDGKGIEWDGNEKFYEYTKWLEYLVGHFLKPWGYSLSGKVKWQGEDSDDKGILVADKNKVKAYSTEEYKVLKTSRKELPLLISRLKTAGGKAALEKKLKRGLSSVQKSVS